MGEARRALQELPSHTHPPTQPSPLLGESGRLDWLTFVAEGAGDKEEEEEEARGGGEGHPPAHFRKALKMPLAVRDRLGLVRRRRVP